MSLDDLVALNDEIAGLVRAGVPLDLGLAGWSRDLSGGLRKTAATLGDSVSQGRSLGDSLADENLHIPPVYRAVVTAGLRSGRLPAALEALSVSAGHLKQLRGAIVLATIYPLLLVGIAYFLFLLLLWLALPAVLAVYDKTPPRALVVANEAAAKIFSGLPIPGTDRVVPYALLPPLVLVIAVAVWWQRTRRAMVIDAGAAVRWLAWIPLAGRAVREAREAAMAEIFGLLVDHGVPLPEAMRLAATCTSDPRIAASATQLAAEIERGQIPKRERLEAAGVPPVLALLMATGARQQTLAAMATQAAETYRTRVVRDVGWLADWLPVWLILIVGSTVGLVYSLAFFVPFSQFMQSLGESIGTSIRVGP
jgi:general secretion pathway protein F